jgi:hypothetical protein
LGLVTGVGFGSVRGGGVRPGGVSFPGIARCARCVRAAVGPAGRPWVPAVTPFD